MMRLFQEAIVEEAHTSDFVDCCTVSFREPNFVGFDDESVDGRSFNDDIPKNIIPPNYWNSECTYGVFPKGCNLVVGDLVHLVATVIEATLLDAHPEDQERYLGLYSHNKTELKDPILEDGLVDYTLESASDDEDVLNRVRTRINFIHAITSASCTACLVGDRCPQFSLGQLLSSNNMK